MRKLKPSVKAAIASTLVLTSTAVGAYAVDNIINNKSEDIGNKLKLDVEKIDRDTVKVAIDNVKDIPKSLQFSIKLDGNVSLKDGKNSIHDLVKKESEQRIKNRQIQETENSILTDYTYNEADNTIDVLITSDSALPKTLDKIDIFTLDVKANSLAKNASTSYKVVPNNASEYKYVSNTNKEYSNLGVVHDNETISMNTAPTIKVDKPYVQVVEGKTLELTAKNLGITMTDADEGDNETLILEVKDKSQNNKVVTEFKQDNPGVYELECVVIDSYNEKSEAINLQVNVVLDDVKEPPTITRGEETLKDITISGGDIFKPLENVKAVDAKGRDLKVDVSIDKELNLDPETDTTYKLTYTATDIYGNTANKVVNLNIIANKAPVITGVENKSIKVGDTFDPKAGVSVTDEDKNIELKVDSNVNTAIPGKYKVSYSATDSKGKTTRVQSTVIVNPKPSLINSVPVITASDKAIKVGDKFTDTEALEGVTAYDKEDHDLTKNIKVDLSQVNTNKVGNYKVVYSVEDSKGAKATKTINVRVNPKPSAINSVPVITASDKVIKVGDKFTNTEALEGVTATDKEDGNITEKIAVESNNVDTNQPGDYTVTYSVEDSKGAKATKTINVRVNPRLIAINSIPVINASDKSINVGDSFTDKDALKGVTAYDKEDGNITDRVKVIENNVNTKQAGNYTVTYSVEDNKGAKAKKTVNVKVYEKMATINAIPVITASDKTIELGDSFTDKDALKGVTATDKEDGNITGKIKVVENNVKPNKEGTYTVTYNVEDSQGAKASKTINVTVKRSIILADSITIENKIDKLYTGSEKTLKASVNKKADIKDIKWETSNEDVASIESVGNSVKIKAKSKGKVTITAKTTDGSNKSDSVEIDIVDFKNEGTISSDIKDVIDTSVVSPVSGNGNIDSPIELHVKDVESGKFNKFVDNLKELNPTVESKYEKDGFTIYKLKLNQKARLFRKSTDTYIEVKVDNNLKNADVIKTALDNISNQAPEIILDGVNTVINVGDKFDKLQGVSAIDAEDGDITGNIKVTGDVDTSKAGDYKLTYEVTDKNGAKTTVTIVVTVIEKEVPVTPESPVIPENPSEPSEPSTQVKPEGSNKPSGENKPNKQENSSSSNTVNKVDNKSESNNKETKEKESTTKGNIPKIKLSSTIDKVYVGDEFNSLDGISATDEEDGDLTDKINVVGEVDTSKVGEYTLTYEVEDNDSNKSTLKRVITVAERESEDENEQATNSNEEPRTIKNEESNSKLGIILASIGLGGLGVGGFVFSKRKKK